MKKMSKVSAESVVRPSQSRILHESVFEMWLFARVSTSNETAAKLAARFIISSLTTLLGRYNCDDFFPRLGPFVSTVSMPCTSKMFYKKLSVNWSVFLRQGGQLVCGFHVGIHACLLPFSFVASCALDCIIRGCFCWRGRQRPCACLSACVGVFSFLHFSFCLMLSSYGRRGSVVEVHSLCQLLLAAVSLWCVRVSVCVSDKLYTYILPPTVLCV